MASASNKQSLKVLIISSEYPPEGQEELEVIKGPLTEGWIDLAVQCRGVTTKPLEKHMTDGDDHFFSPIGVTTTLPRVKA